MVKFLNLIFKEGVTVKKSIFMFFAILLFGSLTFNAVSAKELNTKKENTLFQAKEITNVDELHQRATKGISDIPLKDIPFSTIQLTSTNSPQNINASQLQTKEYSTAQLLSETQSGSTTTENYAVTKFVDVLQTPTLTASSVNGALIAHSLGSGSETNSYNDPTISVEDYSTIYVSLSSYGGTQTIKLTSASGGWKMLDPSVTCTNRNALFGTSGINPVGGAVVSETVPYNNISSYTFSHSTPSNWAYVFRNAYCAVGVTQSCTLHRGGSTWTFTWSNNF